MKITIGHAMMKKENRKRKLLKLLRNERGATAIEFALVSPILFLMIIGIVEIGLVLFATNVVENATTIAARAGITGNNYAGSSLNPDGSLNRVEYVKELIRDESSNVLDADQVHVSCTSLGNSFGNLAGIPAGGYDCGDLIDNEASCSNAGGGDDATLYAVSYCWDLITPLVGQLFTNGQYVIRSSMIVKNEGF